MNMWPFAILLWPATLLEAGRLISDNRVLNICMDAKHHKNEPIATKLYRLCKPWESNACCSNQTAYHSQQAFSQLYGLNLDHCGNMSLKCRRRFFISNCFYECSPNVGPWLTPDRSTIRNERFYHVPLCAIDCDAWWDDCKDDQTCVNNFANGFNWKNGTNHCPPDSTCQSFKYHFHNATDFCEKVFPHDFKVVRNTSALCMKLNFDGPDNPNVKVARSYASMKNMQVSDIGSDSDSKTVTTSTLPGSDGAVPNSTTTKPSSDHNRRAIISMAIIIFLLACLCIGFVACKCKDIFETSKRARTRYFAQFTWYRKGKHSAHTTIHHQQLQDDRQFLHETDEDNDSVLNPHGALEINL